MDVHYLTLPVAKRTDMDDPAAFGAYLAQTWQKGHIPASSLDPDPRPLLVGPGGYGTSEELRQIGRRSALPSLLGTFGGWVAIDRLAEPGATFVCLMAEAAAIIPSHVPKLTLPLRREAAFVFLLDGLDQLTVGREGPNIGHTNSHSRSAAGPNTPTSRSPPRSASRSSGSTSS